MTLSGLCHDAPVSVERRGNGGRSGADGCGNGSYSDGADTIVDHGAPPPSGPMDGCLATMGWHGLMKPAGAFKGRPRGLRTRHNMASIYLGTAPTAILSAR